MDVLYIVFKNELAGIYFAQNLIEGSCTILILTKEGIIAAASRLMRARADVINPLLMDIFPGLTEDEMRRTKVREVLEVIVGLTGFSLDQIKSLTFRKR